MDIMLERVLSLIPKKQDGKYVHGSKKIFCENIGAPPNIVNEWIIGKSRSYRNYLYQISAKYGVSVEWLEGKTDEKSLADPMIDEALLDAQLIRRLCSLTPDEIEKVDSFVQGLIAAR